VPFGIVPLGTANDFNLMAGLPPTIAEAVAVIAAGRTRPIDAGQVNERFFINNSAAAMEPMVTMENIKMKRLSGEVRYIVALLRALARLKPWHMALTWDGGGYEGPAYLLSVCNSPRTGGFMMAPGALLDDGLLNWSSTPQVSRGRSLATILLKLMRGEHVHHPAVTFTALTPSTTSSAAARTPTASCSPAEVVRAIAGRGAVAQQLGLCAHSDAGSTTAPRREPEFTGAGAAVRSRLLPATTGQDSGKLPRARDDSRRDLRAELVRPAARDERFSVE
jgi:hypothetical protein